MADLLNWMETFKDKMDDKSYQIVFETLTVNQFTSRLQLKLLTSDQVDCLQCSYVNRKFKNTKLKPVYTRKYPFQTFTGYFFCPVLW